VIWLLLLLGSITYFIVQRNATGITRTPVWLLWLVMMIPAFSWALWSFVMGEDRSLPLIMLLLPFFVCLPLYIYLVQRGRTDRGPSSSAKPSDGQNSKAVLSEATAQNKADDDSSQASSPRPITQAEEEILKNCFPWSIYYVRSIEYRAQAVICKGQLRSQPDQAYDTVRENVNRHFGDRFLVILQEGMGGQPIFTLVPNPQAQRLNQHVEQSLNRPVLALSLLFATLFTTTVVGAQLTNPGSEGPPQDPALLLTGLPYGLSLMIILGIHELGHYLTARWYQVKATLPYFIPVPPPFLGTFGAFVQMRSPIPNRRILFDISIAGPLAGLVITLPLLFWGLMQSEVVPLPEKQNMLDIQALNPTYSLLLMVISKLALGGALVSDKAIDLHPVAIAGCLGLIVTALNLMPVGQLDGGHIVHAMFGQRAGVMIGQVTRILVLLLSLVQPYLQLWALLLWLMPIVDEPALNDVTELDDRRDLLGLFSLGLLLTIVLPVPNFLATLLL